MGVVSGPKVVSKGLKLFWDPANTDSYPGSGSKLYNLVGSANLSGSTSSTEGLFVMHLLVIIYME